MLRDRQAERKRLAEFEGNPHDAAIEENKLRARIRELEVENQELKYTLYGGRDEGDKGVLRWLRFYEEIASIWAYEARKSREAITALLEERKKGRKEWR
jgi:hypothetical protein